MKRNAHARTSEFFKERHPEFSRELFEQRKGWHVICTTWDVETRTVVLDNFPERTFVQRTQRDHFVGEIANVLPIGRESGVLLVFRVTAYRKDGKLYQTNIGAITLSRRPHRSFYVETSGQMTLHYDPIGDQAKSFEFHHPDTEYVDFSQIVPIADQQIVKIA